MKKNNEEPTVPPKHVRRAEFYKRLNSEVDKEKSEKENKRRVKEQILSKNKGYKQEIKLGWDREDD